MKQWNSMLVAVVVASLIVSPGTAFAQSSGGGDSRHSTGAECGCAAQGETCVPIPNDHGVYRGAYQCECDDPNLCTVCTTECQTCQSGTGSGTDVISVTRDQISGYIDLFPEEYVQQLDNGGTSTLAAAAVPGAVIIETTIAITQTGAEFVTEIYEGLLGGVKGRLLASAPRVAVPANAFVGRTLTLSARGAAAVATQEQWATAWVAANRAGCGILRSLAGGLSLTFAAAVIIAYATPAIAQQVLPITTAKLRDFRTDCQVIHDYIKKIEIDHPFTKSGSCEDCYDKAYSQGTSAPSSATITTCAADMANQNRAYNKMKEIIGSLNENAGTICAIKPHGYFTRRYRNPLLWADRPNVTPLERICPYQP
ncbi:MAG: hypothetical protein JOZ62_16915 [Acidobacteriaceae bacterium]|nr:hypothetical protein [Acidobacteriaceae bacterium]